MQRLENRLKRIEEILLPKKQTIITINYKTSALKSSVTIEDRKFEITNGTNLKEFINGKIESLRLDGIISCIVYRSR